jgi:tetratricopeptide (TPR) repeat protein
MRITSAEKAFSRGMESLDRGEMVEALAHFEASLRLEERAPNPARRARYASYYGYMLAAALGRTREGLHLCRKAADSEFYTPDILLNLARVYLMAGDKKGAWATLMKGLQIDPEHRGLAAEARKMGIRRRPVFPFLDRSHPLNRVAGRLSGRPAARRAKK